MLDADPGNFSSTRPSPDSEITPPYTCYRSMSIDYTFMPDGLFFLRKALDHINKENDNTIGWISYDNGVIDWPEAPDLNREAVDSVTEEMITRQMHEEVIKHNQTLYVPKRRSQYPKTDELIIALWEKVMEDNSVAADKLEAIRLAIKEKYPKPE